MIDLQIEQRMLTACQDGWNDIIAKDKVFVSSFDGGKEEIGHSIASHVKQETCAMLEREFPGLVAYEIYGKKHPKKKDRGSRMKRAYGDCYLYYNGIYNPVNIKVVINNQEDDEDTSSKGGQPNGVALARLFNSLAERKSDSYHFVMVHFDVKTGKLVPNIYVANLLDMLEYVYYASGTGQLLIKNSKLYKHFDSLGTKILPSLNLSRTAIRDLLVTKLDDGIAALIQNRNETRSDMVRRFDINISTIDQSEMEFGS